MDNRGYSKRIIDANKKASLDSLGVRLGRLCIEKDIPVMEVAEMFNISRPTVYAWFIGRFIPRARNEAKLISVIKKLSSK